MIWTGRDGSEDHNVLSLPAMSRYMNDGRRGGLGLDETNACHDGVLMAVAVIMPRQGNTVESCIITSWNKKVE